MVQPALKRKTKPIKGKATTRSVTVAKALQSRQLEEQRRQHELVKQFLPFATSIANRVSQTLSSSVDYDDLLCNARLGLLEAARRYDAAQEVDFRTFAYYRIKGAIYDGLRKSGWLPRSLYARLKFEEAANDYLHYVSQRQGVEQDLQNDQTIISETVNSLASIYVISLDAHEDLDVADENQIGVEERATLHQVRAHMRLAIGALPPKEKQLIMMYYFQNRTLEEAGSRLGLSKSWTSRLHARALGMLMKNIRRLSHEREDGVSTEDGDGAEFAVEA
ncbi:MAG: sigma-70 family RNA polymerase sigma factor [Deltaproteobacteria bacterium]|nr:sigma-70 family RNA polymerase sigma factor [Deltaproteobacteria bacterium]